MADSLAVVIPAYSLKYLDRTLKSFAVQTCRDFRVYVGDDHSPEDIRAVVEGYSDILDIEYHRFGENLGRTDLAAHWRRCIGLVGDEEWIWLFSDDDVAQPDCVKRFRDTAAAGNVDVLHFNLSIIGGDDAVRRVTPDYPEMLGAEAFFDRLYRRRIDARMPEFVFRASAIREKGFVDFDLAWRSDNATVMNLAYPAGIRTIGGENCRVLWRDGGANISARGAHQERKNNTTIAFFNWVAAFFESRKIEPPMSRLYFIKTLIFQLEYRGWKEFLSDCRGAAFRSSFARWFELPLYGIFAVYRLIYRKFE